MIYVRAINKELEKRMNKFQERIDNAISHDARMKLQAEAEEDLYKHYPIVALYEFDIPQRFVSPFRMVANAKRDNLAPEQLEILASVCTPENMPAEFCYVRKDGKLTDTVKCDGTGNPIMRQWHARAYVMEHIAPHLLEELTYALLGTVNPAAVKMVKQNYRIEVCDPVNVTGVGKTQNQSMRDKRKRRKQKRISQSLYSSLDPETAKRLTVVTTQTMPTVSAEAKAEAEAKTEASKRKRETARKRAERIDNAKSKVA